MKRPLIITKLQLERAARKAGCCRDYRGRILRAKSVEELLDIYIKGIRFCMWNDYPSNDYITRHFEKADYNRRGVFIGENLEGKETQHKALVALGYCIGRLHYGDYLVRRLVCKHHANFTITADEHAILMVDILDDAHVRITAKDKARVIVNRYGGHIETASSGEATIKIKNKDPQNITNL